MGGDVMVGNQRTNGILLGLFFGSGCSALIYEVVWFQQLGLVLGASAISLAILLTSFMGGMCLGSMSFPRLVPERWHPLRVYASLELMIAGCGLAVLWLLPVIGRLYWSLAGGAGNDLWMRSSVALVLLVPPTVLMGATLPAISRWVEGSRDGLSRLGLFYAANTLGAVFGSLLAGLYLLRVHDIAVATSIAAGINVVVAGLAAWAAHWQPFEPTFAGDLNEARPERHRATTARIVLGISGLTALGAEVIWTRLLSLLLGPTAYTFSIVLAVFLLGLGIGSTVGAIIGRRVRSPGDALAFCQLMLVAAIPFAAYVITHVIPFWLSAHPADMSPWTRMSLDVLRTMIAILPATCLWGASFPLAVIVAADGRSDNGRLVGGLYSANTVGAIVGAVGFSLFAYPAWGSQAAMQVLTILAGCSGTILMGHLLLTSDSPTAASRRGLRLSGVLALAIACPLTAFLVPVVPNGMLACGRAVESWDSISNYLYISEGVNSTIVVGESRVGNRSFYIAGKVEASTSVQDMRTQRLLGHLPALAHKAPRKVLVVGCGSGMTAGSFLLYPSVETVVICEMESSVIEASSTNFGAQNYGVLNDPRTRIVVDDARHFLATTKEKFDVITTDPIHPWVRGAAALYTLEFLEMCRAHLNPGGVVAQWIPLYESNDAAVRCELATFLEAFPFTTLWSGESRSRGHDVIAIGTATSSFEPAELGRRAAVNPEVCQSLIEVEINSVHILQNMFTAYGMDLREWLRGSEINRDHNLRLQYLAGLAPEGRIEQAIIDQITRQRFPTVQTVSASEVETEQ